MTHQVRVSVVSSAHDRRDARVRRWARAFERAGHQVVVRAVDPAEAWRRPSSRLVRRAMRAAKGPVQAALGQHSDVLIVMDPDLAITALPTRRWFGALIVDVHEDYGRVVSDRGWASGALGPIASTLSRLATFAAARADLTTVADEHVPPLRARRRLVIPNQPSRRELEMSLHRDDQPRALYIGDVRPSRGLHMMVTAVLATPPWQLDIVGPVSTADREWLARQDGDLTRIRLHGRLDFGDSWALAQGAWVGLALLRDTPAFREAIPTKLYEYLGSGLPVLTTPLPRMATLVRASGAGRTASDAAEVASVLREWHANPSLVAAHAQAACRWAAEHLPETSPFDEAVPIVLDIVKGRRP